MRWTRRTDGPGREPSVVARQGTSSSTTIRLLRLAQAGEPAALDRVFERLHGSLRRWAHGRLPAWARRGADTEDMVQEAVVGILPRLKHFEPRHREALRAYLRQCVRNRIRDQIRRVHRRPQEDLDALIAERALDSPLTADEECERLYADALGRLSDDERDLIVGRLEMGFSHDQLALMTGRQSADAARMALKRAVLRLAQLLELH